MGLRGKRNGLNCSWEKVPLLKRKRGQKSEMGGVLT